jgi:hypothetical protein
VAAKPLLPSVSGVACSLCWQTTPSGWLVGGAQVTRLPATLSPWWIQVVRRRASATLHRAAPDRVPLGGDGARFGLAARFDAAGFEVAGKVVGSGVEPAVEVGVRAEVAVGVVGEALRDAGKERMADAADPVGAEDFLEAVLTDGVERVGVRGAGDLAVAVFLVGQAVWSTPPACSLLATRALLS